MVWFMALLTQDEIRAAKVAGRLIVDPCDPGQIDEVSVTLHLAPVLRVYRDTYEPTGNPLRPCLPRPWSGLSPALPLDRESPTDEFPIGPEGITLMPGVFYLGATIEEIHAPHHAVIVCGKSSEARKALVVEAAGLVEPGFRGNITLEIRVDGFPLRVLPGWPVVQARFATLSGAVTPYQRKGNYTGQHAVGPVASRSHLHKPRHVGGGS